MQAYIPPPPRDREALCVQLNAAIGDFRQDAVALKLFGGSTDVREQKGAVQAEAGDRPLFYSWLGDALLRFEFVVAGNELPALVRPSDLKRLGLEPRAALVQAVQNARARWGSVKPKAGANGVWQLEGENPRYLAWTWFVPSLWASLTKAMKAPLLVAIPCRGEVLFAPATKAAAVGIGFLDRFGGSLLLTGDVASVEAALREVLRYFDSVLHYDLTELTRS